MIVIGADTHKRTHTCAAVCATSGRHYDCLTTPVGQTGFEQLLAWAAHLDAERVWALEDCRHVSGSLERFLINQNEHVIRIPPKLMGTTRKNQRQPGKSDPIDATAVARAAIREGLDTFPKASIDERSQNIKLLVTHREHLIATRTQTQQRLRWHLHDLYPEYQIPAAALNSTKWLDRIARKLAATKQQTTNQHTTTQILIARQLITDIRHHTTQTQHLQQQLTTLVKQTNPQLLDLPGCGPLTAAKLIAETNNIKRFKTQAKFARLAGVAPIPASSGQTNRHRLHKGGNRQLNTALHRIAITQTRTHPPARAYITRKQTQGKTKKEAIRSLKRHLARTTYNLLKQQQPHTPLT